MSEIDIQKKNLRKQAKEKLLKISAKQRSQYSNAITNTLLQTNEFKKAGVVMIFLSLPHEVDTTKIILQAWQMGKTVVVPKVSWQQRHMIAVKINSLEAGFSIDTMGLKNPITGTPTAMEDIDIVVTPGLCFDRTGKRIGHGGGYFDRFFANKRLRAFKCAICFSNQIFDQIQVDETDISVDCLITEKEILRF